MLQDGITRRMGANVYLRSHPPTIALNLQYRMYGVEQEYAQCDDEYELARAGSIISTAFSIIAIRNKALRMSSPLRSASCSLLDRHLRSHPPAVALNVQYRMQSVEQEYALSVRMVTANPTQQSGKIYYVYHYRSTKLSASEKKNLVVVRSQFHDTLTAIAEQRVPRANQENASAQAKHRVQLKVWAAKRKHYEYTLFCLAQQHVRQVRWTKKAI